MEFMRKFIKKEIKNNAMKEAINLKNALFFWENGDDDQSVEILDGVIVRNPKHAHAYYLRGRAKWWRQKFLTDNGDALADLEKAEELGSKSARSIIREIQKHKEELDYEIMSWLRDQESAKIYEKRKV
jgi:hypothetical protein